MFYFIILFSFFGRPYFAQLEQICRRNWCGRLQPSMIAAPNVIMCFFIYLPLHSLEIIAKKLVNKSHSRGVPSSDQTSRSFTKLKVAFDSRKNSTYPIPRPLLVDIFLQFNDLYINKILNIFLHCQNKAHAFCHLCRSTRN